MTQCYSKSTKFEEKFSADYFLNNAQELDEDERQLVKNKGGGGGGGMD